MDLEHARAEALELVLTPEWTPLDPHPVQSLLAHHPARFKICNTPRRGGKTIVAKRYMVLELLMESDHPRRIGVGAPTYTRCKDIYFEDLDKLIPKTWIKKKRESQMSMEFITHWGASIRLLGMNNPKSVEGVIWDHFMGDEFPDWPEKSFALHLRPALATKGREGSAWLFGVPDADGLNQAEYYALWQRGIRWPEDPEICSFWWPASDIIDPAEVESMREGMDVDTFNQEVLGLFVNSGGTAFRSFNEIYHASNKAYCEYTPFLPIDHTFDFGTRPAASLICQQYKNQAWVIDEIVINDGNTESACEAFIKRCGDLGIGFGRGIRIFGDAAGRTPQSAVGKSDYETIREYYGQWHIEMLNMTHNPNVRDTLKVVRTRLRNAKGIVNLFIHPRCKNLIAQMKAAQYPSDMRAYHLVAALRYWLYKVYSVDSGVVSVSTGQMTRRELTPQQMASARYTR